MDIRAGLLSWFVKALSDDIKQLSLSDTKTEKYNYNYYLTARDHDKQRQQNPDNESSNQLTLSDYNHAIKTSSETWQQALMSNLKKVTEQWQALTDQLNDLMGMDAPVFAPVTDLLVDLTQHLRPLIPEYSDSTSSVSAQESVADTMDSIGESAMSDSSGQAASTKILAQPVLILVTEIIKAIVSKRLNY